MKAASRFLLLKRTTFQGKNQDKKNAGSGNNFDAGLRMIRRKAAFSMGGCSENKRDGG
jgi:hypothetical protein